MEEALLDSNSTLPWSWVIEALAKSPLVNTSILYGLLSKVPPLLGVSGKEAREAIALRCLEGLLNYPNALKFNDNVRVSDVCEIRFDLQESCEVALQCLTSGSKASSNDLNSDLELFIKHKKSSLSKSTLEMLNETISEGTNSLFSFLKEANELDDVQEKQDQSMLNPPFNGGDPLSPSSKSGEDNHDDRILLEKENGYSSSSSSSTHGTNNNVQDIDVVSNYEQYPPSKKLKMDNVCGFESKQDRSVSLGGNEMLNDLKDGQFNEVNKTNDGKSNACGIESKKDHLVSLGGNEMLNDIEGGQFDQVDKTIEINDGKSNVCRFESKQDYSVSLGGNEMFNDIENVQFNLVNKTIEIHDGKSNVCGTVSKQDHAVSLGGNENDIQDGKFNQVNKTIEIHDGKSNKKDKRYNQHISPNNGGKRCREEVDLAINNKSTNLSSLCGVTRDSLAMTESQPNMCMKCNKDGQLLSCSGNNCALSFHERCLGSSISFDDIGNFYCPFCAYSRAISEYVRAKERVSLARKNLSLFIGGRPGDPPEQTGNTSSSDDVIEENFKNSDRTVKKGTTSITNDAENFPNSLKGKSLELSRSSSYLNANGRVLASQQHLSIRDAQRGEIIIRLSQGPPQGCDGARFCDNERIENGSVIIAELKRKSENTMCKIKEIHGDASSESISDSISDSERLVEYKRNDGASSLPFPKPLREVPRWRRKKVPWTVEEEAMLKKGVETFVQAEGQVIPWKAILEYGGSVFQPGRTPVDLKDKWRNITARGTSPKMK